MSGRCSTTSTSATNTAGDQREWWFHSSGCREWFQAERNTTRNEVLQVARPGELAGSREQAGG